MGSDPPKFPGPGIKGGLTSLPTVPFPIPGSGIPPDHRECTSLGGLSWALCRPPGIQPSPGTARRHPITVRETSVPLPADPRGVGKPTHAGAAHDLDAEIGRPRKVPAFFICSPVGTCPGYARPLSSGLRRTHARASCFPRPIGGRVWGGAKLHAGHGPPPALSAGRLFVNPLWSQPPSLCE